MSKIRINELARELEVKPNVILDMLAEYGVEDKKTHSSSVDEDVALALRKRLASLGPLAKEQDFLFVAEPPAAAPFEAPEIPEPRAAAPPPRAAWRGAVT